MSEVKKINLAELKNIYRKGLLIPEIQRDYVMGAGGKSKNSDSDKLTGLLDAILLSFDEKKDFDFSCIITFCKDDDFDNNRLEIYDGQQRLTTLMLLVLFCLQREEGEKYKDYKEWYRFCGRSIANEILEQLTNDEFQIESIKVRDFTSFSMKNLLTVFSKKRYEKITSDFLLNMVKFDRVEIGNKNEIEQFFMDLNSGVKLKEYELYKAKLVHHINQVAKLDGVDNDYKTMLEIWPHRLDNEWLNIFKPFADFQHPAEEYEVEFIRYCFRMLCKYENIESKDGITNINLTILKGCFDIMNSLAKVLFTKKTNSKPQVIEFSWGSRDECTTIEKYYNYEKRGAYWNLDFNNTTEQLYYVIKKVLLNDKVNAELDTDLIVWACITTLDWQIDYQDEYIRMLKIMLNHIWKINSEAWYECQNKGQYLYYSKYSVINIPSYYGEHLKNECTCDEKNREYDCVHDLVKDFWENKRYWKRILNRRAVSENIMEEMKKAYHGDTSIIENRRKWLGKYQTYGEFCKMESKSNGILRDDEKDHYLAKVNLSWPTQGSNSKYKDCFVLLKCYMDKVYDDYIEKNDEIVKAYERIYQNNSIFDKEKCFWVSINKAYRIMDRSSSCAKTYIKKGGTDNYYWAYRFDCINAPEKE